MKHASLVAMVLATIYAVACVAKVLGWLAGAVSAPAALVIALVLLAAGVICLWEPSQPQFTKANRWQIVYYSVLTIVFCYVYLYNVTLGHYQSPFMEQPC